MKDIFISYASEDRPIAQRLAAGLEGAGLSVWWDRHIEVGSEWDKTIEEALAAAKCVVVLWTGHAKHSRWVRAEAREALKQEKVVPVMLEPNAIPLAFTGIQALRFLGWAGRAGTQEFDILHGVIQAKLEGKPVELPEASSTKASPVGKLAALAGIKSGLGGGLALLLVISYLVRMDPVVSVQVETTRMEFQVAPGLDDRRLTDALTFDRLTVENVGMFSLRPDRLLVADPADYDMVSDSYPPKAWLDVKASGQRIQFEAVGGRQFSEVTMESTDHEENGAGQLESLVLTGEAEVMVEVGDDNAVTWAIRKPEGRQRVVVSGLQAVQFMQTGLQAPREERIPFPQNQELTYQAMFERTPGTIELVGRDSSMALVLQDKGLESEKPILSSVMPVQAVDFSWQDPGTGERRPPRQFKGTVEYRSPQGLASVRIEEPSFLTLDHLDRFELISIVLDPHRHILRVHLQGQAGYIKAGTAGNPVDLRPRLFDAIRYHPLFEPVRNLLGF